MKWTTKLSITLLHFIAEVDTLALTVGEPRQGLCGALIQREIQFSEIPAFSKHYVNISLTHWCLVVPVVP